MGLVFLKNEAVMLEQALIQYSLEVAMKRGWTLVTPPSIVYTHIAAACGFQPRDQHGEQQIYVLQQAEKDRRKPELCLAGTAEIPLAGMKANTTMNQDELPLKLVGVSRCYRAEAGARGVDTKGLYRVHEFTKVEMFAWTSPVPEDSSSLSSTISSASSEAIFNEMVEIQSEILTSLDLSCRILEMPSTDLGASATRKRDIEAYFPSRHRRRHRRFHQPGIDQDQSHGNVDADGNSHSNDGDESGWGEVTSASICSDYQTRRLATRVRLASSPSSSSSSSSLTPANHHGHGHGQLTYPHTVNGTALAVPRVLAALLENGWDPNERAVRIPHVLRPWMRGLDMITRRKKEERGGGR